MGDKYGAPMRYLQGMALVPKALAGVVAVVAIGTTA